MSSFIFNDKSEILNIDLIERIVVSGVNLLITMLDGTTITYVYGSGPLAVAAFKQYYKILAGLTNTKTLYSIVAASAPASLTLVSITPNTGSVGDGATLVGTGFLGSPTLYIEVGTTIVTSFAVIDDANLSLIVPAGLTPGVYDVVISYNPDFSAPVATLAASYTVV